MRLILKTKSRYINFYWINIQKEKIVGWFAQDYVRKLLSIPDENHFESHFTLPKDGNYHFSYKSMNRDKEEYINVFHDYVKIKTISNGLRDTTQKPRIEFEVENPYIATLVPEYRLEPLKTLKHFQFPVVGFNVYEGDIESKKGERGIDMTSLNSDDILVDVSLDDDVNLNIYAMIRTTDNEDTFSKSAYKTCRKSLSLFDDRCLELICNINKNKFIP